MASDSQATAIYPSDDPLTTRDLPRRRRTSARSRRPSHTMLISPSPEHDEGGEKGRNWLGIDAPLSSHDHDEIDSTIPIHSSSKAAGQNVAPYLANNVPQTYNPVNVVPSLIPTDTEPNTMYCNRHRPDMKCRRQADEESMDNLQNALGTLSKSDQQGISHVWSLFSAAPAKQRNLMLRGILSVCCYPQLSFISTTIRDLIKIDYISMLPPELAFRILCFLDTTSLCKAAQVSQRWRTLADDDVVWHRMCEQHIDRKCTRCGWGLPLLDRKRLRTEKRQIQLRASGKGLGEGGSDVASVSRPSTAGRESIVSTAVSTATPTKRPIDTEHASAAPEPKRVCAPKNTHKEMSKRPWKDVYKKRFVVGTNWKHGRCSLRVLKGHTNGVMCLQFRDNILATGSYDTTIKIWDLESGEVIRTLEGHTGGIRCLQFDDSKLMSGSIDGTVRIWNWRTGECHRVMPSQRGGIISLHFDTRYLACGTMENAIRVWSTCDNSTFTLKGHTDFVNSVKVDSASRTLFSASDDCTVRLWDLETRRCIRIYDGHVGQVQQVLPLPAEFEFDEEDLLNPGAIDPDTDTDYENYDTASNGSDHEQDHLHYHHHDHPRQRNHEHAHAEQTPRVRRPTPPPLENLSMFPTQRDRPNPSQFMLTGALDSTIRLWHVPTGRCLRTFFGHLEGIWALAADTLRVVSGAEDRMIKVWDPRTGKCERTFTGHTGPVTCIGLSGERLISGGEDCEVRILEFDVAEEVQEVQEVEPRALGGKEIWVRSQDTMSRAAGKSQSPV